MSAPVFASPASVRIRAALPVAITSFVGREREVGDLLVLLASARLLTLTGVGGGGKTRLALAVAEKVAITFVDGVCWLELARVNDPAFVPQALAKALGIAEQPGVALLETLLEHLGKTHILLVLDNCEHILRACAELVGSLLNAPGLKVLATSREPLGIAGEARYPVPPLALPELGRGFAGTSQSAAVRLFVERARSVRPDFALTRENAEPVADLCRQLDGLPLAIELASARLDLMSVWQLGERLGHGFELLVAGASTEARHRTLRAAIDWSFERLSPAERLLLGRLSVFATGFALGRAEAACGWGELASYDMLELLSSLITKSLVVAEALDAAEARYRLLETIRQYAAEQLRASGAWGETCDRYLQAYVSFAEGVAPQLSGWEQERWLNALEREQDNLRAALEWAHQRGRFAAGLRLAVALFSFWDARGYVREGFSWFERLLEMPEPVAAALPLALRVSALTYGAFLAAFLGDVRASTRWAEDAVRFAEAAGEAGKPLLSFALAGLDSAARVAGDWGAALGVLERTLQLEREGSDPRGKVMGMTLYVCGMTEAALGYFEAAHRDLNEALALAEEAGDLHRMAITHSALGDLARFEGRFRAALPLYERGLSLFREAGAERLLPDAERNFAYACLRVGDTARAHVLLRQSLERQRARHERTGILRGLLGFAALAAALGQYEASARLQGAAQGNRKAPFIYLESGDKADELDDAHYAALVRGHLGDLELAAAFEGGRALHLDEAVAFALALDVRPPKPPAHDLTRRERDVAGWIAAGLPNGDIARRLGLSKRTVEKHVANILAKLGLANRAQVVRWALEQSLSRPSAEDER